MHDTWVLILAMPPGLVALAVALDSRLRRGFGLGFLVALVLVLGAMAQTFIAGQWRWLAIIATVSFLPAVIIIAPGTALVPDVLAELGLSPGGEAEVLLLLPVLVTFVYAIARSIRRPLVS